MTHSEYCAEVATAAQAGTRLHTLRVNGAFPPGWAGRVAAGLAARSISIVRGRARRDGPISWRGEFEVAPPPGTQVEGLDVAVLAWLRNPSPGAPTRVTLTRFRVEELPGELLVAVEARDQVGLLERLLGVFAMFGLFPREMELDTRGGVAMDRFYLRAVGDRSPPADLAAALRGMLARLAD